MALLTQEQQEWTKKFIKHSVITFFGTFSFFLSTGFQQIDPTAIEYSTYWGLGALLFRIAIEAMLKTLPILFSTIASLLGYKKD